MVSAVFDLDQSRKAICCAIFRFSPSCKCSRMENAYDFFRRLHRVCGPNEDEVAAISEQGTLTTRALRPLSKLPQLRAPVLSSTRRPKVTKTKIKKARPLKPVFFIACLVYFFALGRQKSRKCPLLAQSGHAELHRTCPLSGVKRTWTCAPHMSAFDPKRTLLASSSTPSGRRKPLIWFASPGSCEDRSGLSGLARCGLVRYWARARWGARLDTNCLGSFNDLRGLLDLEMQHTFVEMSFNGSLFRLKR